MKKMAVIDLLVIVPVLESVIEMIATMKDAAAVVVTAMKNLREVAATINLRLLHVATMMFPLHLLVMIVTVVVLLHRPLAVMTIDAPTIAVEAVVVADTTMIAEAARLLVLVRMVTAQMLAQVVAAVVLQAVAVVAVAAQIPALAVPNVNARPRIPSPSLNANALAPLGTFILPDSKLSRPCKPSSPAASIFPVNLAQPCLLALVWALSWPT